MKKYFALSTAFFVFATTTHGQVSTFNNGIVVGGTSLSSGLILDVNGKLGAQELCNESGGECTDVTTIFNVIGGSGINGNGTSGYVPRFSSGTNLTNSVIRQSGDSNIGIGVAGMANGDSQSSKLRVFGSIKTDGNHLYLRGHDLYSDNSSALYIDSNHDTITQVILRDAQNTTYGRLHGTGNGTNFGLLDADGQWSVLAVNNSHIELRDNGLVSFSAGQGGVSGNYGTVSTKGAGKGGWEGYSINGNYVLMNNDNGVDAQVGLYNDMGNSWIWQYQRDAWFQINQPATNTGRLRVHSNGRVGIGSTAAPSAPLEVFGDVAAQRYCDADGNNCLDVGEFNDEVTSTLNLGEDIYGNWTSANSGTVDTCNSGNDPYTCSVDTAQNCVDRRRTISTTSGAKSGTTNTAYGYNQRNVDCKIFIIKGNIQG